MGQPKERSRNHQRGEREQAQKTKAKIECEKEISELEQAPEQQKK